MLSKTFRKKQQELSKTETITNAVKKHQFKRLHNNKIEKLI